MFFITMPNLDLPAHLGCRSSFSQNLVLPNLWMEDEWVRRH